MDTPQLLELLADGPVIAAVKDDNGLKRALRSEAPVLFLLYGDILTIRDTVAQVREAGKRVFVHLDLVEGLSTREIARVLSLGQGAVRMRLSRGREQLRQALKGDYFDE